jgi:hypothetical protein
MQQNNFFVKIILVCIMVLIGGGNSEKVKNYLYLLTLSVLHYWNFTISISVKISIVMQ